MYREVFIDTGVWFAYLVKKDRYHQRGVIVMDQLLSEGTLLSSSELVISETYTLLMRKLGTSAALRFLELLQEQIAEGFTKIYWADTDILKQSANILNKYADHRLSFTDAASAAIMMKHHLMAIA